ncbi:hypothetical protein GCM10010129_84030 [Streptomyces fumigatiscleroticus]|nr:hypothetical protein GCM10010129_84030 [Streptomyces fumigatiscleroticus]
MTPDLSHDTILHSFLTWLVELPEDITYHTGSTTCIEGLFEISLPWFSIFLSGSFFYLLLLSTTD